MKKLVLFVLPLIAAAMLFSGMGKKPSVEEESTLAQTMKCSECSKDCKVCAKDMKNCGKEGCTCRVVDCNPGMKCCMNWKDCKLCAKDMKNCGKEGCTCMKMDMKDMKGMKHEKMKGKKSDTTAKLFVRKPTKEELGKEATCPVMTDETFKVSVVTPVIDYKGKAYYMCCDGCPQKFIANPEKYVK